MSVTKTIEQWEALRGVILTGAVDLSKQLTAEEFDAIIRDQTNYIGVNHADRKQFLSDNGYKITRETMVDHTLESKPTPE